MKPPVSHLIANDAQGPSMTQASHMEVAPPRPAQICFACKLPFRFGLKSDPAANVYSIDGKKEVAISGVCERCFDEAFDEDGDYWDDAAAVVRGDA